MRKGLIQFKAKLQITVIKPLIIIRIIIIILTRVLITLRLIIDDTARDEQDITRRPIFCGFLA